MSIIGANSIGSFALATAFGADGVVDVVARSSGPNPLSEGYDSEYTMYMLYGLKERL